MDSCDLLHFQGRTRGINLINIIDHVKLKRGKIGLDDLVSKARGEVPALRERSINEKAWYPLHYELTLLESTCNYLGGSAHENASAIGKYSAENIGFLKFFVKFARNPNSLAVDAQNQWKNFYDFGKMVLEMNEPKMIVIRIDGLPKHELFMHAIRGTYEGIAALAGVKNAKVDMVGDYRYKVTW